MPRRPIVRLMAVGSSSLPLLMAVQSALAQQYTLQHTAVVNLSSQFFYPNSGTGAPGSDYGSIPVTVAFDGTNAYIGGYNGTAATATAGIVEVANLLGGSPTLTPLPNSLFAANSSRGLNGLAYDSTTGKLYAAYDSGSAATSTVTQLALDGTPGWQVTSPYSARPATLAIDPHGDKDTNGPAIGLLIQGSGRRVSLKLADGSNSYSPSGQPAPNGDIINTANIPATTTWRSLAFDAQGNMLMGNARAVDYAVNTGVNSFSSLTGAAHASTAVVYKDVSGSNDYNNIGLGVAIIHGAGTSDLLAYSQRAPIQNQPTVNYTNSAGGTGSIITNAVQISNVDGTTTGLTQTLLTGGEDGLGLNYPSTSTQKDLYYTQDANGLPELLVLDIVSERLDAYTLEPTWTSTGAGSWSTGSNWLLSVVPNSTLANARFGSAITAPSTVTVDGPKTVKVLKFDNLNKYTIAGPGTITMDSSGNPYMYVLSGSHEISAPLVFNKNTVADIAPNSTLTISGAYSTATSSIALVKNNSGTLAMKNLRFGDVYINGGTISIMPNGTSAGLSVVTGLHPGGSTDNWTASVDINNNPVLLDYDINTTVVSPILDVANQIKQGYNGGSWTGNGITSSTAAAVAADAGNTHKTAVGYAEASTTNTTSFFGHAVDSDAVLIRYTYSGDANCDGVVNALDFNAVASNFGQGGLLWQNGDFNFDGTVDTSDFVALASNFNLSMPSTGASLGSLVPEPSMLFVGAISAALLANRRRRT